jgi:HAE1 family hydrophobic/amphiphilic exporter-1
MLILALAVVGVFSYFTLGVDLYPRIDFPTITVTVVNPGASPEDIETEVTEKVESAVNTISGIDELRSTSVEGVSQVFITFLLEKDPDVAAAETRDKIDLIRSDLPETAESPIITKLDTDATPVLRLVISGPNDLREVTDIADREIGQRLESVNGVGQVQLIGGSRREIQVQIDPNRLRAYNLTPTDVANAVRAQNLTLPGGRINEGPRELSVRTLGRMIDPEQFDQIVIATREGYPVKVRDIGRAMDAAEEMRTASRLNGQPAVSLLVSKQSGQNTVAVADAVKRRLAEIKRTLPPGYRAEVIADQSIYIKAAVESIQTHLIEGGLLAALVVYLFLWNFRSTLIASIAIPTSIVSTFGLMAAMGYTLNQITMLALTLMVGIVIDDAIVALENIYRFIEEKGLPPFRAAIEGTREIGLAVLATTLSLLAVFLPVGFMGGIVGRFMSSFGLTASFAILVSMIVSFTLTPMLSARLIKPKEEERRGEAERDGDGVQQDDVTEELMDSESIAPSPRRPVAPSLESPVPQSHDSSVPPPPAAHTSKEGWVYRKIDHAYKWMLEWSMAHRKTIVVLSLLTIFSIFPLFMFIGKNFLPEDDQAQFEITVRTPAGTSLPATMTVIGRIADEVRRLPGVTDTLTTVGRGQQESATNGSIYVRLKPIEDRALSQTQLMTRARALLTRFPKELRASVQQVATMSGGGMRNADVQYVISGPDLNMLTAYSEELLKRMKKIPDVVDADTSLIIGRPELRIVIDRRRAADLGARVSDIAQALNILVAGQKVSTFSVGGGAGGDSGKSGAPATAPKEGGSAGEARRQGGASTEEYDVVVRALGQFRRNKTDLQKMTVPSSNGGVITLDQVVQIEEGVGPSSIDRLNRQRQVTLSANVRPGGSQSQVIAKLNEIVKEMKIEPGYTTGLAGRSKELGRAGYYFGLAFALSFIFMYMVLAAQFESFIHPITILLTLPLAVPFGIISLLVMRQTVNIFSGLGLLLLFGIVKKNAILQIDHTNGLRANGTPRYQAIIQANRDRLRPILMTTIALVAGMLPLVASSGPGTGTNRSIGVLVVGGQSLCLLLTLLAVPVFYSLFEDLAESAIWRRIAGRSDRLKTGARALTTEITRPILNLFRRRPRRMGIVATLIPALLISQTAPAVGAQTLNQPGAQSQAGAAPQQGGQAAQSPASPPVVTPVYKTPDVPMTPTDRVGVDPRNQMSLTLAEAVILALNNNNDIDIARIDTIFAEYNLKAARGVYDPVFSSDLFYENRVIPVSNILAGGPDGSVNEREYTANLRLSGATPAGGGSYQLDFFVSRLTTDNQFVALIPQYPSSLTLTYVQPLWRGLRFDDNRRRIEVAKKNLTLTDAQFRQRIIEIVTQVEQAYWDLVFALRELSVQTSAVEQARRQRESNRRLEQEGLLASIDIVAAETQVATFEQNVYIAMEAVSTAENKLKTLMLPDRASPLWARALLPTTPVSIAPPRVSLGEAIRSALINRPELQQLQVSAEINEINTRFYRDQTHPQIDFYTILKGAGLAGTPTPTVLNPISENQTELQTRVNELSLLAGLPPLPPPDVAIFPPLLIGGLPRSLGNLFTFQFPTYRVGLRISLPLFNRTAEAQLGRSLAEASRITNQREQLEQNIEAEVRNALQSVRSNEARVAAAAVARSTASQQYESEQRRFQAGLSTTFLVLQRQTDLLSASSRELQAQTALNKSISELQRVTGVTLRAHNILLQAAPGQPKCGINTLRPTATNCK